MQIVISGILGKMGHSLVESAEDNAMCIVAGFDKTRTSIMDIPVYADIDDLPTDIDCAIDFSSPEGTIKIADWCVSRMIPLISGTTGLSSDLKLRLKKNSSTIPIFYAENMSLGVGILSEFCKITAKTFPDADSEIIEIHHRHKVDSPSGTALYFANKILEARNLRNNSIIFGRKGHTGERPKGQIGIHSLRAGEITGEHQILFADDDEEIIFIHRAKNRKLFAKGAFNAVRWIKGKPPGFYSMDDLVKSIIGGV